MTTGMRSTLLVLAAGALLSVAAGGGAVAGGLVTGKRIKDDTITTRDVRDGTLGLVDLSAAAKAGLQGAPGATGAVGTAGPAGISGYELLHTHQAFAAHTNASLSLSCPFGKRIISGTAWWEWESRDAEVAIFTDAGATAYSLGPPQADTLNLTIVCATA